MTSSAGQDFSCWRMARPCPQGESPSSPLRSCQAWFRCEMAGDYVIRWRCQTTASNPDPLPVNSSTPALCHNQSDSRQLLECPPPVVCADGFYKNPNQRSGAMSTDIIIVIVLAVVAFFSVLLIIVSSYKYWALKRRYKTQHRGSERYPARRVLVRDYQFPVPYYSLWGQARPHSQGDSAKTSNTSKPHGNPHADIYFSRPRESWRNLQHLIPSSDDSLAYGLHRDPDNWDSNRDRLSADPSVLAGSFIYHQPVRLAASFEDLRGGAPMWFPRGIPVSDLDQLENSLDYYQVYHGNQRRFQTHAQQSNTENSTHYRHEYRRHQRVQSTSSYYPRTGQVSSIPIPVLGMSELLEGNIRNHIQHEAELQGHKKTKNPPASQRIVHKITDSDSSIDSASHFALGLVSKSSGTHQLDIINREVHQVNQPHPNLARANHSTPGGQPVTGSHRPSPDVISSHNFTNRFVRVGQNLYRPVLTQSPSLSSLSLSSLSNHIQSYNNNNVHNNDNNSSVDISYDSFLNEHLKQLARRGTASSSTLEAPAKRQTSKVIVTGSGY